MINNVFLIILSLRFIPITNIECILFLRTLLFNFFNSQDAAPKKHFIKTLSIHTKHVSIHIFLPQTTFTNNKKYYQINTSMNIKTYLISPRSSATAIQPSKKCLQYYNFHPVYKED